MRSRRTICEAARKVEIAARRTTLEKTRREVERLEEIKKHNAAQARLSIFSADHCDEVEHQSAILTEQGQDT